ncbi:MAG TPA: hypothetical protein VER79_09645, partial [Candidatus Limnocylindrales bacterium]|nr:hypothetical protein [Candidatus Limnocylindrales bacterium]
MMRKGASNERKTGVPRIYAPQINTTDSSQGTRVEEKPERPLFAPEWPVSQFFCSLSAMNLQRSAFVRNA